MKKVLFSLFAVIAIVLFGSCQGHKQVAYFQNIDSISLAASRYLYDARIMPKDELTITVNASNPDVASQFNLSVSKTTSNTTTQLSSQQALITYLVDNDGYINFPKLGKIHAQGMTKTQLQDYIFKGIKPYFAEKENPIVTVSTSNYRVTVMGAVTSPKVVTVTSEKMSVLEAIASAGDLSIYGKRENVMLIREDASGEKTSHRLNLTDANIFNSPYYYVQQNDIIYVEPNKTMAKNSDIGQSTTIWFSFVSVVVTVANLVLNVLR